MLESLLTKHGLVKRELLETVLKTNHDLFLKRIDFIMKTVSKIKDIEKFISGIILMNKNCYFGNYSLGYNADLLSSLQEKDDKKFLKIFTNPTSSDIFSNYNLSKETLDEIKYYYNLEKMTYFYLYQKKFTIVFIILILDRYKNSKKKYTVFMKRI